MSKRTKVRRPIRRKAKPSTALVRMTTQVARVARELRAAPMPAPMPSPDERTVNEGIAVGALGLVELKLTPAEERILDEPVPVDRIQWRPRLVDGPPEIPYLPHPEYTKWFNRAFGRTGWALVPVGKPGMTANSTNPERQTITCPYVLHVHGKPVAFAMGEQEYYEKNKQQTYGDALESTVASALRRCAKRLGVGLEMWDRTFLASLPKPRYAGPAPKTVDPREPPARPAPESYNPAAGQTITEPQVKRLWVIAGNSGRSNEEVKKWLVQRYQIDSSKQILRRDYEVICAALEAPGSLP